MPAFFQFQKFLTYWLDAVDSHSLHSPFLFDFYTHVLAEAKERKPLAAAEQIRRELHANHARITVTDRGSGSRNNADARRKVSEIARTSLSTARYSAIYARIIAYYRCKQVLELGTSLGINTLYLGSSANTVVTTFDGAPEIARLARDNFAKVHASNIRIVEGDIADTLPAFLSENPGIDFVLMDANHRYQPTLSYYQVMRPHFHRGTVVVMDDIHYHPEMEKAWHDIRNSPEVYTSIDLFRAGILFFDPSLNKQHVVIQL